MSQEEIGNTPWDIVTGVGMTALGVAAGRAMETSRSDRLVNDPYAAAFVAAAKTPVPIPARADEGGPQAGMWESMATYVGIRSRLFDEFFATASGTGLRQVVLLAAGLDTRAYRLDWAPDTVVYEVDVPKVLGFKEAVLAEQGAIVRCTRHTVPADLRADWDVALAEAGFDTDTPTAWLAEGLLPYLPDDAKDSLFGRMHALSMPGSMIAAEHYDGDIAILNATPISRDVRQHAGIDMPGLLPKEQRFDPAGWLTEHGWRVRIERAFAVGERYGRTLDESTIGTIRTTILLTAEAH
jgi:methyltransferase (TIGR00027 family)